MTEADGHLCAKTFKYLCQFNKPNLEFILPIERIRAKSFYEKNQKLFDNLAETFKKRDIDPLQYIHFAVVIQKLSEKNLAKNLLSMQLISKYIDYLSIAEKYRKVFKSFQKSVDAISDECAKLDIRYAQDYMRELIATKRLAVMYMTGKISKYWLAAIPKFNLLISKLDQMTKDELRPIANMFETYSREIYEACINQLGHQIQVFDYTNKAIAKKIQQTNQNKV